VSDELAAREIHCLTYDTRALSEDALFICKGAHFKEEYLCDALSRGAIAYVAEKKHNVDAPCLLVNDIRYSLVVLGQLFYNHVTDKLTSVGITGTKGKSTTAYYVRYILNDWLAHVVDARVRHSLLYRQLRRQEHRGVPHHHARGA